MAAWEGTIGFTLIATGFAVAGASILWLLSVAQDAMHEDELRPVRHEGRGGRPSEADGPVLGNDEAIARLHGEGL